MTRSLIAFVIGACLNLAVSPVMHASQPPSPVSLVLLYDLTVPPVGVDVRLDPRLKLVLRVVSEGMANGDTVRVGLLAGKVSWSRTFGVEDRSLVYPEVVNNPSIPVVDRLQLPALCDGLYDAVTAVAHDDGRRAVVVITNGFSGGNIHSFDELVADARDAHVSLSAVHGRWPGTPGQSPQQYQAYWNQFPVSPSALLTKIASATGGTYVAPHPHASGDLKRRFNDVLAAIHQKDESFRKPSDPSAESPDADPRPHPIRISSDSLRPGLRRHVRSPSEMSHSKPIPCQDRQIVNAGAESSNLKLARKNA